MALNRNNRCSCDMGMSDSGDIPIVYEADDHLHSAPICSSAAEDLMRLVGRAIEDWAVKHNMQNLPKSILFEQALAILNALYKNKTI